MMRRQASSQARVKSSYAANDENLSQSLLTASTWDSSGRLRSPLSCRLYGGSANTRSTEPAASFDISATQSPTTIRGLELCAGRPCRRPATRLNHDSITLTQATLSATRD